ncbi:hypothetical protein SteCoe_22985 [Stentor coeruleus]|uniref:UBC core domain-containing protein n=1 Tax=Stentor coeruleus TaxID=5963 RepID=A0A1R2BL17_9CILI|nr:hypothetical protein SteCoe_22985 [Stentor coeruleus]
MLSRAQKRLQREYEEMTKSYTEMFQVRIKDDSMMTWEVSFVGAQGTIFAGEPYTLQFKFNPNYPIESPEVIFLGRYPEHEHVYSNGYICLSILYDEWSPSMRVSSVVLSIQSMLSSATHKSRPKNDAQFSSYANGRSPKSFNWIFEDEKC